MRDGTLKRIVVKFIPPPMLDENSFPSSPFPLLALFSTGFFLSGCALDGPALLLRRTNGDPTTQPASASTQGRKLNLSLERVFLSFSRGIEELGCREGKRKVHSHFYFPPFLAPPLTCLVNYCKKHKIYFMHEACKITYVPRMVSSFPKHDVKFLKLNCLKFCL